MTTSYCKSIVLDYDEKMTLQKAIEVLDNFLDELGNEDRGLRTLITEAQNTMERLKYEEFTYEG